MTPRLIDELIKNTSMFDSMGNLWIFGYGSLIWKPGFKYHRRVVGYVNDYKRRFYQGTTTHRGTEEWPGRVATLISAKGCVTWGVAYQISGVEDIRCALAHLAEREMITGGYRFDKVFFQPAYLNSDTDNTAAFYIQVYIAESGNDQWLGKATLAEQAFQMARARGVCGNNMEYAKKVAVFMSEEVQDGRDRDPHLFSLVELIETYSKADVNAEDMIGHEALKKLPIRVAQPRVDNELIASARSITCTCSKEVVFESKPQLYDEVRLRHSSLAQLEDYDWKSSSMTQQF